MGNSREVKVFKVSVSEEEEPLYFELQFTKPDGKTETHEFAAIANPGAGANFALGSIVQHDDNGKQIVNIIGIKAYFSRVLIGGDYDRFLELIDRKDLHVEMDDIAEVFKWLVEEQTGRPTEASSSSSDGRRATGRKSTAAASSVG